MTKLVLFFVRQFIYFSTFEQWLGKDHDEVIHQTLKDSNVIATERYSQKWKWELIIPVLRVILLFF